MDIVTHAGIGLIAAAPLIGSQPEIALGIVAGSVLPDLDALSRVFGKRAFLRAHQTWSHSIFTQAAFSIAIGLLAEHLGIDGTILGIGLFAGLAFHTFLDYTNTLGVTLLAPFSRKRYCLEWVFFIDGVVLAATMIFTVLSIADFVRSNQVPAKYALAFITILTIYIFAKGILRRRAGLFAPDAISLIPSALYPWRFLGMAGRIASIQLFEIDAITSRREPLVEQKVFDDLYVSLLQEIPEFALMKKLSPAYHVVSTRKIDAGELIRCRDLRTRNFATTFGDLEVLISPEKRTQVIKFHV